METTILCQAANTTHGVLHNIATLEYHSLLQARILAAKRKLPITLEYF